MRLGEDNFMASISSQAIRLGVEDAELENAPNSITLGVHLQDQLSGRLAEARRGEAPMSRFKRILFVSRAGCGHTDSLAARSAEAQKLWILPVAPRPLSREE